jgi:hypothetical protein
MTYNEGWIEVLKDGAGVPLDSAKEGLDRFGTLESRPGHGDYWVPKLQRWAQAEAHPIHYIDNCWLRVAVSAADLIAFLQSIDQPESTWIGPLIAKVDQADSYIIIAEEF